MGYLFLLAIAPVLICLFYIFIRDKYEKEPLRLLLTGVVMGIVITFPIMKTGNVVSSFMPILGYRGEALYTSFLVASLVEESFKFIVLFFLTFWNHNLNERFDGIVYAVFISLGFAGVENVLYVINPVLGGVGTALARAVFSVPGHGFFGIIMGYYFALSKLEPNKKMLHIAKAFFVTFAIHGIYNYILLSGTPYYLVIFVIFSAALWYTGFKKMKLHLNASPFKHKSYNK